VENDVTSRSALDAILEKTLDVITAPSPKQATDMLGPSLTFETLVTHRELGNFSPSPTQLALIRAVDGQPVTHLSATKMLFHFGSDVLPPCKPRCIVLRTGVRAGKSMIAAMALMYSILKSQFRRPALEYERPDADGLVGVQPGELVRGLIVAPLLKQARAVFKWVVTIAQRSPVLSKLLVKSGAEQAIIRRPDGNEVTVELVAASSGGGNLRGTWLAGIVFDEADFHDAEDGAVNLPDNYRAAITRMLGGAQVWVVSSPWAEEGPFHEMFTAAFGKASRAALAFHSDTRSMNPTLSLEDEEAEFRRDPINAAREYSAVPLSANASAFFPESCIAVAVAKGRQALTPNGSQHYAGADLGFRKNSSALATARVEDSRVRVAMYDELVPASGSPLKPSEVVQRFASTCRSYNCHMMQGDMYYADTAHDELRRWSETEKWAVSYDEVQPTAAAKAEWFTLMRTLMSEGKCELPDDPRLINQLRGVKARAAPGGVIQIQLPKQGQSHGDILAAVVLAVWQAAEKIGKPPPTKKGDIFCQDLGLDY
jgi:hypothetical protein